ncbi:hypothetical protein PGIGA_G00057570 [Pangasianodon gigas]|uniref:Uncharacterized protein n=1 Tax=Pangasianodon gigas TaxID=30993 RepID=A0ACC5X443_PANGG|nr:hypothetical protein [Pangasianodon gigas]
MFCDVTSTTGTTEQTTISSTAIIITVLVFICRRKRGVDLPRQESIYYRNSVVPHTVEHNGYKSSEQEKDNYEPKPPLTPKEEPIYINVQGESSLESSVEGTRTENIYCNVGYYTQH